MEPDEPVPPSQGKRTPEQIREHYELERALADRLRHASKEQRRVLYSSLYDELFRQIPHHAQLTRKASPQKSAASVAAQLRLLGPYLSERKTFLELGPGDCALCVEVATKVRHVYAIDVSAEITKNTRFPANLDLILSDGCSVPVPAGSVAVAFSNQLMEHLHPEDALEQLHNIWTALSPGGVYICITPNRLNGPHDISKYFDVVATGFHLKEYTAFELVHLLRRQGFETIIAIVGGQRYFAHVPIMLPLACEWLLEFLPLGLRSAITKRPPARQLLGIRLVAIKPHA